MRRRLPSARSRVLPWLADVVVAGGLAAIVTAIVYRPWERSLEVPFEYTGDTLTQATVVKGIIETGWYNNNPRLGAPQGFVVHDFPLGGENLHYLIIKILTWFSSNAFVVLNVYFLLSFILVAMTAVVAFRLLGLRRIVAHPLALLYAFVPAHMLRGTHHVALAAMWAVPLALVVVVKVMSGEQFIEIDRSRRWKVVWTPRATGALVLLAVVSGGGSYYIVFTAVLLVLAGVFAAFEQRRVVGLIVGVATAAVQLGLLVLNVLPSLWYQHFHGKNPMAMYRSASQLDGLSLRPAQMLSPVPGHRLNILNQLAQRLAKASPGQEPAQYLGLVAAIGLVIVVVAFVRAAFARDNHHSTAERGAGAIVLLAVVIGSTGGLALIPAVVGFDVVRAWGRISVFLAFLSLLGFGLWWQRHSRGWRPAAMAAAAVVIAVVGIWDQTPSSAIVTVNSDRTQFDEDHRFVTGLEALIPAGSMVFQLPQASYPEEPMINQLPVDNLLRPYLQSTTLRWSFGGIRGGRTDWMEATAAEPMPQFLDALAAIGYRAVVLDRRGFADGGTAVIASLTAELGGSPLQSSTDRLEMFDLGPRHDRLLAAKGQQALDALARAETGRPHLWWGKGFDIPSRVDGRFQFRAENHGTGTVLREADGPGSIRLTFHVEGVGRLRVAAGGSTIEVALDSSGADGAIDVPLVHRQTPITWDIVGDPAAFVVSNVRVEAQP